jgi:hypothetical protein
MFCKKHKQFYSSECPDCKRNSLVKGKDKGKTPTNKLSGVGKSERHPQLWGYVPLFLTKEDKEKAKNEKE